MSGFTTEEVRFKSVDGECGATLTRPAGEGPFPAVVLCHGLGAVREMRLQANAERFAEAGIVALNFTYRHFGDSSGEPRQLLDIGKQRDCNPIQAASEKSPAKPPTKPKSLFFIITCT